MEGVSEQVVEVTVKEAKGVEERVKVVKEGRATCRHTWFALTMMIYCMSSLLQRKNDTCLLPKKRRN